MSTGRMTPPKLLNMLICNLTKSVHCFLRVVCGPPAKIIWNTGSWTPFSNCWSKSVCFAFFFFLFFKKVLSSDSDVLYKLRTTSLVIQVRVFQSRLHIITWKLKKKKKSFWKIFTHQFLDRAHAYFKDPPRYKPDSRNHWLRLCSDLDL